MKAALGRAFYVHWSGAVEKAVREALCLINMEPEKPQV